MHYWLLNYRNSWGLPNLGFLLAHSYHPKNCIRQKSAILCTPSLSRSLVSSLSFPFFLFFLILVGRGCVPFPLRSGDRSLDIISQRFHSEFHSLASRSVCFEIVAPSFVFGIEFQLEARNGNFKTS